MKRILKEKKIDMGKCFVVATFLSLLCTVAILFISHGELFSKIFFHDNLDTGMDFFHSIEYVRGRIPYEKYSTLYPPFANLCFYILFLLTPYWQHNQWTETFEEGIAARGSNIDLRIWQPTLLMFILFVLISSLCLFILIQKIIGNMEFANLIILSFMFSYGVLWAFERGNIIIISLICCLFFLKYKDSNNKVVSELALIMLAASAGLKLYPAIFGMILIYEKQYKKAFRTCIYGILFFVLPFFAFREGIGGFPILLDNVISFGENGIASVDGLVKIIFQNIERCLGISIDSKIILNLGAVFRFFSIILVLISGFFLKKNWQRNLACCLAFMLLQIPGGYVTIFYIIPFLFMIIEEEDISRKNIVPFLGLICTQLLLPIWDAENSVFSIVNSRFRICTYILLIYILIICCLEIKYLYKKNR